MADLEDLREAVTVADGTGVTNAWLGERRRRRGVDVRRTMIDNRNGAKRRDDCLNRSDSDDGLLTDSIGTLRYYVPAYPLRTGFDSSCSPRKVQSRSRLVQHSP